jgi:hypothetical protein
MVMNCKDCRHWEKDDHMIKNLNLPVEDTAFCSLHSLDGAADIKNVLALAICFSEGIDGELITRGDFGCVSFEGKANE